MKIKPLIFSTSLLTLVLFLFCSLPSFAFVNCQSKYDDDKRALPKLKGMCNVCHVNASGSGPQNDFGKAFKNAGFMITNKLVEQFPELFKQETNDTEDGAGSSSSGEPALSNPKIKRTKPKAVKVNVESMIKIIGKNFVEGATAFVDDNEVVTEFKSQAKLIINLILDTVGLHELKIQNPDGQESNTIQIKAKEPKAKKKKKKK